MTTKDKLMTAKFLHLPSKDGLMTGKDDHITAKDNIITTKDDHFTTKDAQMFYFYKHITANYIHMTDRDSPITTFFGKPNNNIHKNTTQYFPPCTYMLQQSIIELLFVTA